MPDLAESLARRLNRGADPIMYAAIALRGSPARGPRSWGADRLALLKRTVFAPWRVLARATPLARSTVVFDVALPPEEQAHRLAFTRKHFAEEVDFVSAATPKRARGGVLRWLGWYLYGIGLALRALADFSERRYFWLGQQMLEVQALALAAGGIKRAYVFRMFDRRPYLAATYLARRTAAEVLPVFQNIPLWRNCRYFHLGTPVVLTSRVNVPEVEWLTKSGMFVAGEVVYRSQEFVDDIPEPAEPTVDIGFISSGEWARRDGLYQVADPAPVRAGEFVSNAYALAAKDLLGWLVEYAKARSLTLRIYPHPYERRLAEQHGIYAPWAESVDGSQITADKGGANSRGKLYEPRVAVSLQSSYIWERLDLGLEQSFMFDFADPEMNVFNEQALGEFRRNVFVSREELFARLDETFAR